MAEKTQTTEAAPGPSVVDLGPDTGSFREDVIYGLQQTPKAIPCKYLYDARGRRFSTGSVNWRPTT